LLCLTEGIITQSQKWRIPFFTVWTGQAFSLVGSALVRFALIWWLTEETGSATTLAVASVVTMLPLIVLGPFGGALVDRWNRRWVMVISDGIIALLTVLLAYLYWLEVAQVWQVYVILFLRSLGGTFQDSAMRASTSLMAPKEQLTRVSGMNETLQGIVNVVSPPLGALLLEVLDMQGTLAIDVVTAVMAVVPLFFVRVPQPHRPGRAGARSLPDPAPPVYGGAVPPLDKWQSVLRDTVEGFRYIWGWRGLFFLLAVLAMVRFFIAPPMSMLPLLVKRYYDGGALQLAWMNSASGFGFVAGGVILSLWGGFRRRTVTALVGLFGVGVGTVIFGLVPATAFGIALVVMFLRTLMVPIIRGPIVAIFQSSTPPEMQGRLFTVLMSVISVMAPLGLVIGGPLADAFGVRLLFILGGAGMVLMALIWVFTPTVLDLEDHPRPKASEEQNK
jgi:DHA3 family macrolide efflux protein-like MFS transporter